MTALPSSSIKSVFLSCLAVSRPCGIIVSMRAKINVEMAYPCLGLEEEAQAVAAVQHGVRADAIEEALKGVLAARHKLIAEAAEVAYWDHTASDTATLRAAKQGKTRQKAFKRDIKTATLRTEAMLLGKRGDDAGGVLAYELLAQPDKVLVAAPDGGITCGKGGKSSLKAETMTVSNQG